MPVGQALNICMDGLKELSPSQSHLLRKLVYLESRIDHKKDHTSLSLSFSLCVYIYTYLSLSVCLYILSRVILSILFNSL